MTVGTSTPGSDPSGDYAEQVFANIDARQPGAKAALDAKARRLVGGPTSPTVPAGQNALVYFIETTGQADVFLTYATSALAASRVAPDLQTVELPGALAVSAQYGLTVLNGADPAAGALADYILSPAGQAGLASYGFGAPGPVSGPAAVPEPAAGAVLGVALTGLAALRRRRGATAADARGSGAEAQGPRA